MAVPESQLRASRNYISRCRRIQIVLNQNSTKDKIILDYLEANDTGKPDATQVKDLLIRFIKIQEALGNT